MRILYILLVLFVISCSKKNKNGFKVKSGEMTESVYASGVVKSVGQYTVFSTVNGILNKTKVVVGQQINEGYFIF